jgi:hypothetical protein
MKHLCLEHAHLMPNIAQNMRLSSIYDRIQCGIIYSKLNLYRSFLPVKPESPQMTSSFQILQLK